MTRLLLASGSETRRRMLQNAGIPFDVVPARIDEHALRAGWTEEGAKPREIADALAEAKAQKVGLKHPEAITLGCDQVLEHRGAILAKPETPDEARAQIRRLSGDSHSLISAVVAFHEGKPVWRHVDTARMTLRRIGPEYLDAYVDRNWERIRHSAGGYQVEGEGVRLFSRIDGDFFTILGLPLLPLLSWLIARGTLPA